MKIMTRRKCCEKWLYCLSVMSLISYDVSSRSPVINIIIVIIIIIIIIIIIYYDKLEDC